MPVGRPCLIPAQAKASATAARPSNRWLIMSGSPANRCSRKALEGGGELREGMRIALLAGDVLAFDENRTGLGGLASGGVQHAELEIGREVVRSATEEVLELRRGLRRIALSLQLEGQGVSRKRVVRRGGDEVPQLLDAIHVPGPLIAERSARVQGRARLLKGRRQPADRYPSGSLRPRWPLPGHVRPRRYVPGSPAVPREPGAGRAARPRPGAGASRFPGSRDRCIRRTGGKRLARDRAAHRTDRCPP